MRGREVQTKHSENSDKGKATFCLKRREFEGRFYGRRTSEMSLKRMDKVPIGNLKGRELFRNSGRKTCG